MQLNAAKLTLRAAIGFLAVAIAGLLLSDPLTEMYWSNPDGLGSWAPILSNVAILSLAATAVLALVHIVIRRLGRAPNSDTERDE
jgi:hypothetical protein